MVTAVENEMLTRVGPGTPMGALMRQYWVPACLSSELVADGDPMRLALLGEKLVAFRDTAGRVGILDNRCVHRCTPLFLGRNEENGLRCIYHGWKFDVHGQCLEMPNVMPDKDFHEKVRAKAYKVQERHGIVYCYMGSRAEPPPLPMLDVLQHPLSRHAEAGARAVTVRCSMRDNNWLQSLEGDLDTSHFAFLHLGKVNPEDLDPNDMHRTMVAHRAADMQVKVTPYGVMYTAGRPYGEDQKYYRAAQFLFPFWTMFPDSGFDGNIVATAWVPLDDTHTMQFSFFSTDRPATHSTLRDGRPIPGLAIPNKSYLDDAADAFLPNTTDWFGRWRYAHNRTNDYGMDREAQRRDIFSGIAGLPIQDMAVTEGMGDILDRTLEHLAPTDIMTVQVRRRLLRAAQALADGTPPPLAEDPELARGVRSGCYIVPASADWYDEYVKALQSQLEKERGVREPVPAK
jgi:phthalate 4,5-dioxygenase